MAFPVASLNADEAEMQRILTAHKKWMASVVTLHLKCEMISLPLSEDKSPIPTTNRSNRRELEWAWTDRGQFRHQNIFFHDEKVDWRSMQMEDAERSYRVSYPRGQSTENRPKEVGIGPARLDSEGLVIPLFGLWYNRRSEWLGDLLAAGCGTWQGYETVDGVPCPKLDVERAPGVIETVVLDPKHNYLPVVVWTASNTWHQKITSFRELKPGVWIPEAGLFRTVVEGETRSVQQWRIVDLKYNQDLPISLFRPVIPKGTSVIDSLKGEHYRQGMPRRRRSARQVTHEAQENLAGLSENDPNVSAVPQPFFWRRWGATLLLVVSVTLISAAIWLKWRRIT